MEGLAMVKNGHRVKKAPDVEHPLSQSDRPGFESGPAIRTPDSSHYPLAV